VNLSRWILDTFPDCIRGDVTFTSAGLVEVEMKRIILAILTLLLMATSAFADSAHDNLVDQISKDPYCDLSNLSDNLFGILDEAAQIDAQISVKTHNAPEWEDKAVNIGLAHAIKHHLIGNAARIYQLYFWTTVHALIEDQ
jgi:hypothetical protein